jgi:toxin ParE1/3/4
VEEVPPLKLRVTRRAIRHLSEIESYIAKDSPQAAMRVGIRLRSTFELLCQFPEMGRSVRDARFLEWTVPGLPYVISYRAKTDAIEILGILHGMRQNRGP